MESCVRVILTCHACNTRLVDMDVVVVGRGQTVKQDTIVNQSSIICAECSSPFVIIDDDLARDIAAFWENLDQGDQV